MKLTLVEQMYRWMFGVKRLTVKEVEERYNKTPRLYQNMTYDQVMDTLQKLGLIKPS